MIGRRRRRRALCREEVAVRIEVVEELDGMDCWLMVLFISRSVDVKVVVSDNSVTQ